MECEENSYLDQILTVLEKMSIKFPRSHEDIIGFITGRVFKTPNISSEGAESVKKALINILIKQEDKELLFSYKGKIINNFKLIRSS